jgi:hypothetical protein
MRWALDFAFMREMGSTYSIVVRSLKEKEPPGKSRNILLILTEA